MCCRLRSFWYLSHTFKDTGYMFFVTPTVCLKAAHKQKQHLSNTIMLFLIQTEAHSDHSDLQETLYLLPLNIQRIQSLYATTPLPCTFIVGPFSRVYDCCAAVTPSALFPINSLLFIQYNRMSSQRTCSHCSST